MPRYFFDIHDDVDTIDQEGLDLPDVGSAREEAVRGLVEIAREVLPGNAPEKDLWVTVRDAEGSPVFTVRIIFTTSAAPGALPVANGDSTGY